MTEHRHPVGLTLGYRATPEEPVMPVTITGHMGGTGQVMYSVENQLNGDFFFAQESELVARTADYLQLARAYEMVAKGFEAKAAEAESRFEVQESMELMQASNRAYVESIKLVGAATARLRRRPQVSE